MSVETDLQYQIANAIDPLVAKCASAELAAFHARMGRFEAAGEIVRNLRATADWRSARLHSLIMLAEGLIGLRNEYDKSARDRLERGFAVASAFRELDVSGLIAAWLAHVSFNRLDADDASKWLQVCAALRAELGLSAKSRVCLTAASMLLFATDRRRADSWFQAGRSNAQRLKDKATISASMFNRSALGISNARVDEALGTLDRDAVELLGLEIQSAMSYANAIDNRAAPESHRLYAARLELLRGEWAKANDSIGEALLSQPEAVEAHFRIPIESDLAYCAMRLNKFDVCNSLLRVLPSNVDSFLHADDKVVYYFQRSAIADATADPVTAEDARRRMNKASTDLAQIRMRMCSAVIEFDPVWN